MRRTLTITLYSRDDSGALEDLVDGELGRDALSLEALRDELAAHANDVLENAGLDERIGAQS